MRLRPADRASEHRPTDAVALPRIGDGDRDLSDVVADRLDADVTDDHGIAARVEAFRHDPFPVLVIRSAEERCRGVGDARGRAVEPGGSAVRRETCVEGRQARPDRGA